MFTANTFSDVMREKVKKYAKDYVALDTVLVEVGDDEIRYDVVEIAAIKVEAGKITDEFRTLVNPGNLNSSHSIAFYGITNEMVEDAPPIDKVLPLFLEFVGNMPLVGFGIHLYAIDVIRRDVAVCLSKSFDNDYIDTRILARMYLPQLAHYYQKDLVIYYGIKYFTGRYRAYKACPVHKQIFEKLVEETEKPPKVENPFRGGCPMCGGPMDFGLFGDYDGKIFKVKMYECQNSRCGHYRFLVWNKERNKMTTIYPYKTDNPYSFFL